VIVYPPNIALQVQAGSHALIAAARGAIVTDS
jgi:hypothetical protein